MQQWINIIAPKWCWDSEINYAGKQYWGNQIISPKDAVKCFCYLRMGTSFFNLRPCSYQFWVIAFLNCISDQLPSQHQGSMRSQYDEAPGMFIQSQLCSGSGETIYLPYCWQSGINSIRIGYICLHLLLIPLTLGVIVRNVNAQKNTPNPKFQSKFQSKAQSWLQPGCRFDAD